MNKVSKIMNRWVPALVVMLIIFLFSNTPASNLPNYGLLDFLVKKGAHMIGYGLLFLTLSRGMGIKDRSNFVIIFLWIVLYACSDEFHQSFISGRHSSFVDVLIDFLGSLIACLGLLRYRSLERVVFLGLQSGKE